MGADGGFETDTKGGKRMELNDFLARHSSLSVRSFQGQAESSQPVRAARLVRLPESGCARCCLPTR